MILGDILSALTQQQEEQSQCMGTLPFATYCVISVTDYLNFGTYLESFVQMSLTSTSRRAAISHDVFGYTVQKHSENV